MNDTQKIIDRCRRAWTLAKQRVGLQKARDKARREKIAAQVDLIFDDLAAEGVDVRTPLGQEILARVVKQKFGQDEEEYKSALWEDWPEGF